MRRPVCTLSSLAISLAAAGLLGGCGPQGGRVSTTEARRGAATFSLYCVPCHGRDGRGVEAQAPPLAGSPRLRGSPSQAVRVVLYGHQLPAATTDRTYQARMPAFGRVLSDAQVAEVVTYARERFGDATEPVSPDDVARARDSAPGELDLFTSGRAPRPMDK